MKSRYIALVLVWLFFFNIYWPNLATFVGFVYQDGKPYLNTLTESPIFYLMISGLIATLLTWLCFWIQKMLKSPKRRIFFWVTTLIFWGAFLYFPIKVLPCLKNLNLTPQTVFSLTPSYSFSFCYGPQYEAPLRVYSAYPGADAVLVYVFHHFPFIYFFSSLFLSWISLRMLVYVRHFHPSRRRAHAKKAHRSV